MDFSTSKALRGLALATAVLTSSATGLLAQDSPNILVIWGDDVGRSYISAYTVGMMGYRTPNIDRVANWCHDCAAERG